MEEAHRSDTDPRFVSLATLVRLKLHSRRHQDLADVVGLLKGMDEGAYLSLELATPSALRSQLVALRRDALEELFWQK